MKKQVGRPPEKRQRIGPRKILRSKKDKKTCPGLGQGRKRGNAAHDERPAAAGAACRAYAGPDPAPAHKTGACIRPHTAKIRSGHKRTSGTPLLGRRPAHDHTASPPPEAAPAGCRPGRRRMSALAGRGSAGYNGGGSAVARRLSCASCTPAKIIGQIPMCRSLPDGKLTKSDPHGHSGRRFLFRGPGDDFRYRPKKAFRTAAYPAATGRRG